MEGEGEEGNRSNISRRTAVYTYHKYQTQQSGGYEARAVRPEYTGGRRNLCRKDRKRYPSVYFDTAPPPSYTHATQYMIYLCISYEMSVYVISKPLGIVTNRCSDPKAC